MTDAQRLNEAASTGARKEFHFVLAHENITNMDAHAIFGIDVTRPIVPVRKK